MERRGEGARLAFMIAINVVITILSMIPWERVATRIFPKTTESDPG